MIPPSRAAPSASPPKAAGRPRHTVMVVDDSAVIRGLITRILESDDDLEVVASVPNGRVAVDAVARRPVDVIVLDIEMPVMDGLEALPLLLRACPTTKVVMASTLTKRNADISMKALQAGATDYIAKPTSTREIHSAEAFRGELLEKVRALAGAARPAGPAGGGGRAPAPRKVFSAEARQGVPARGRAPAGAPETARRARPGDGGNAALRAFPGDLHPAILAIGSSTGGPQALFQVLRHLSGALSVPLVLTQHMPPTFTTILAEHISRQCNLPAAEGVDGEPLLAGRCYVAPGDWHMTVAGSPGQAKLRLHQGPLVNFCRPAVDPMLQSVVQVYGARVLAVILTGMGQDGMVGCRAVTAAGGGVVAQDEATSVVWGMPGAVTVDGTAGAVLPVGEIGPFLRRHLARAAA